MRLVPIALLFILLAASPEIRYFRHQRPIHTASQALGQTCFVIDPTIFAQAAPGLADLRMYGNGTETPYAMRTAAATEAAEISIQPLNLGSRKGETVFDAELPSTHYSDVVLSISAQNFIATITVTGSKSQSDGPGTRVGSYTIFDLSGQKLGRSTVLHLPESDFPYLHFRISGPLRPEQIDGISIERLPATQPSYQTVAESSQAVQNGRTTVLEFTVPPHVPVDRITFIPGPSPELFSRDVAISATPVAQSRPADQEQLPQTITSAGNLLRVHKMQDGKRIDEEHLAIDAPREVFDASSKWTVTIENGDDPAVSLLSVRLEMLERTLCFDAVANSSYTLYYGDPSLRAPRYDYVTLFAPQSHAAHAVAGPEQANPSWQPRPDQRPFTEKHPALLWIALVAVILLLATIALRYQKQITSSR